MNNGSTSVPWPLGAALAASLTCSALLAQTRGLVLPRDPEPRSGQVTATPATMAQAVEEAVRRDAAVLWQRGDHGRALSVRIEAVTWPDGAIGCPAPDRLYTQAAVPGWRIRVGDENRVASYHAVRGGRWLLCPYGRIQAPLPAAAIR